MQNWHGDHFSTGVEIEQAVLNEAHPRNVKEVQKLSFGVPDVREMHRLTILNPDDGNFRLTFTNPDDLKRYFSGELRADQDIWKCRDSLNQYFNTRGLNAICDIKKYNAENVETTVDVVKTVIEFRLDRLVDSPSYSGITFVKGTSKA